jgi:hypothetical protein
MEKICPKCNALHNKNGIYCSRKCANSRNWGELDKEKISNGVKNSKKFKELTSSENWKKHMSKIAKKQSEEGKINFQNLHSLEVQEQARKTKRKNWLEKISTEEITDRKKYRNNCQFHFDLKNYPEEFDFNLIKEYGWYSASNKGGNINGISRDHMFSIFDGYKNKVNPILISHPANCQLLRHEENFHIKNCKSSITLGELKNRIIDWNKKYIAGE